MKILMFGWEFPPLLSGGLGTACYGLTKALLKIKDINLLFVMPATSGEEKMGNMKFINAGQAEISKKKKSSHKTHKKIIGEPKFHTIKTGATLFPYHEPTEEGQEAIMNWNYQIQQDNNASEITVGNNKNKLTGEYGPNLLEEVFLYGELGGEIAASNDFDVIHAHDWLTYPAGIMAKKVTKKPLIIHVHATEFDRAGEGRINEKVFSIEKEGMEKADHIIAVSNWTKNILISKYNVSASKITVVHNGIEQEEINNIKANHSFLNNQLVTFLGRITYQKGPEYFVEAAKKVLEKYPCTHFVMAGSGDLLPQMIEYVAKLQIASHFHFTGFLNKAQVNKVWELTNVYVMPSVSEPFGIAPLEAIAAGVPVIISKQSGVSEVLEDAIKIDFWDVEALAEAICSVLKFKGLHQTLKQESSIKLKFISWDAAAEKINQVYHDILK